MNAEHNCGALDGRLAISMSPSHTSTEGWVAQITRDDDGALVNLVLADGRSVSTHVTREEMQWLGLYVDQIVHVRSVG